MIIRTKADIDKIIQVLKGLDLTKVWKCVIKQRRGQRSIPQNSLYWLWITRIKDVTGNKVDLIRKDRRGNENTVNGLDIALIQEKKVLFVTGYEDQKI